MVKGSAIWMNNKANRVGHMNEKDGKNRERERERERERDGGMVRRQSSKKVKKIPKLIRESIMSL